MNIVEFRKLVEEIKADSSDDPKKIVENEKKISDAVMSISLDGEDGEEIINEILNLLWDFPAVLQLLRMMAGELPCGSQNPGFSTARALFSDVGK